MDRNRSNAIVGSQHSTSVALLAKVAVVVVGGGGGGSSGGGTDKQSFTC